MPPPGVAFLQQIECEMGLCPLKQELKDLLTAGMHLLDQALQIVDRMSLLAFLITFCVCLLTTSVIYVTIWKQSAHLDLVLGNNATIMSLPFIIHQNSMCKLNHVFIKFST